MWLHYSFPTSPQTSTHSWQSRLLMHIIYPTFLPVIPFDWHLYNICDLVLRLMVHISCLNARNNEDQSEVISIGGVTMCDEVNTKCNQFNCCNMCRIKYHECHFCVVQYPPPSSLAVLADGNRGTFDPPPG